MNEHLKKKIILLRYGIIGDVSRVFMTCKEIALKLGVSLGRISMLIHRYKKNGHRLVPQAERRYRSPFKMGDELKAQLLSAEVLRKMAHLSLRSRVPLIANLYGCKISRETLRVLYRKHGIRFMKATHLLPSASPELRPAK